MRRMWIVLVAAVVAMALDDMTISNTYSSGEVLTAAKLNQDNDSTRLVFNRLNDTLEAAFARYSDMRAILRDSNFQKINVDSIRSNPSIDSFAGPTIVSNKITVDSLVTVGDIRSTTGDISVDNITGDSIQGNKIGVGRAPTQALDLYGGGSNIQMNVTTDSTVRSARLYLDVGEPDTPFVEIVGFGRTYTTGSFFGVNKQGNGFLRCGPKAGFAVGTTTNTKLVLGTNDTARVTINGNGDSLKLSSVTTLAGSSTIADFQKVLADTVDGNPRIDSIAGPTVVSNKITADSLVTVGAIRSSAGDISVDNITGDSIQGNKLGIGRACNYGLVDVYSASDIARLQVVAGDTTQYSHILALAEGGTNDPYVSLRTYGKSVAGTLLGINAAQNAFVVSQYTGSGVGIGSLDAIPVVLGTNNTARVTINGNGDSLKLSNITRLAGESTDATLDTATVKGLTVGSGSAIDSINILDGTSDTLVISVGSKNWKFVPTGSL